MNPPPLSLANVTVRYQPDSAPALDDVSFTMAPGERVALLGLNGSGKTTLLAAAAGLVAHEGEIQVAGERLTRHTVAHIRERLGFLFNVPEDQLLFPRVIDDVSFGLLRHGSNTREAATRAIEALELLGVSSLTHRSVHHLSHGQKQRVALAGALVTGPALLLLDEPSAALDPPGKRALATVLGNLGAAMLVATHDLDFASRFCSRFLLLEQGKLISDSLDCDSVNRRWGLRGGPT